MHPRDFELTYLSPGWREADLQFLLQKRIKSLSPWPVVSESRIKTPSTTRRADLATWLCVYEVKKVLTRDEIFHAVAQTELYVNYGSKILGFIPKRRVVVGLAPWGEAEYLAAKSVANDYIKMGIQVVFLNENPHWRGGMNFGQSLPTALGALVAGLISYLLVSLVTQWF